VSKDIYSNADYRITARLDQARGQRNN